MDFRAIAHERTLALPKKTEVTALVRSLAPSQQQFDVNQTSQQNMNEWL
jgi:hypothetical protein